MTLAAAALLTPGRGRVGRDVLAEPGGHPAQDAVVDLAGYPPARRRPGSARLGAGGTVEGDARARADCPDTPDRSEVTNRYL
jgi:hypothetical protein